MSEMLNQVTVTSLMMRTLENACKDYGKRCIMECSKKYGFDCEEAISIMNVENLKIKEKSMKKRGEKEEKKEKKESVKLVLPFEIWNVREEGCQGLKYNHGLFTQCESDKMKSGIYCKGCQKEADNSSNGMPECGTVEMRKSIGLMDYKDNKGRKVKHYLKVLEKQKMNVEDAKVSMSREMSEVHLKEEKKEKKVKEVVVKEDKKRGRPKKEAKAIETDDGVEDLFARLVIDDVMESVAVEEEKVTKKEDEKASKKLALEKEKAEKKATLEKEKAEKKLAQEKEKAEKKLAQEKEKADKKVALEKEKAEKGATKNKSSKKVEKEEVAKKEEKEEVEEVEEKKVRVSKKTINGKIYLMSSEKILYDEVTKEAIGMYDEERNTIEDLPDEEDEELDEDEYDE